MENENNQEEEKRKYEYHELPLFTLQTIRIYHCRRCGKSSIPFPRDLRKNSKVPIKCPKCHSRKWQIPVKYLEECIRCGYFWDRRDYTTINKQSRNLKCPKCKRRDYRREDWMKQINYKAEIKLDKKKELKEEKRNKDVVDDTKKVIFIEHLEEKKYMKSTFDKLE